MCKTICKALSVVGTPPRCDKVVLKLGLFITNIL